MGGGCSRELGGERREAWGVGELEVEDVVRWWEECAGLFDACGTRWWGDWRGGVSAWCAIVSCLVCFVEGGLRLEVEVDEDD